MSTNDRALPKSPTASQYEGKKAKRMAFWSLAIAMSTIPFTYTGCKSKKTASQDEPSVLGGLIENIGLPPIEKQKPTADDEPEKVPELERKQPAKQQQSTSHKPQQKQRKQPTQQPEQKQHETPSPQKRPDVDPSASFDPFEILDAVIEIGNEGSKQGNDVVNELIGLTPEERRQIGLDFHRSNRAEHKGLVAESARLAKLAAPLLAQASNSDGFRFFEIDSSEINAFSHVGGYVYFYRGLLERLQNDVEIQFVIGHEIAHVELRHCEKRIVPSYRAGEMVGPLGEFIGSGHQTIGLAYAEDEEFASDEWSYRRLQSIGYTSRDILGALERFPPGTKRSSDKTLPGRIGGYVQDHFRTHPAREERIERLRGLKSN